MHEAWIKPAEGSIHLRTDRNGRHYAIVNSAYVGSKLLDGISESQNVSIIAIQQEDERRSALTLKLV